MTNLLSMIATLENIKQYTDKLDLTCDEKSCQDILDYANEWEIADTKTAVWEFLDAYEGICHSRDPEFWQIRRMKYEHI